MTDSKRVASHLAADDVRVFAYCHDSVGIGHLVRTTAICRRLTREFPSLSFLIATGTPYVPLFESLPRVDYIKLPALRKLGAQTYESKFLPSATAALMRCRQTLIRGTLEYFDPAIVLIDKAPLGVCSEMRSVLEWLRKDRPATRIIFGMRDIEDSPQATCAQWNGAGVPRMLEECFDEIWVYGMRSLFDVVEAYHLSPTIESKLRYVGYVANGSCDHETPNAKPGRDRPPFTRSVKGEGADDRRQRNVLVTVGGGTDGEFLLRRYLDEAALRLASAGLTSTIVAGPDLPDPIATDLASRCDRIPGAEWIRFERCMNCRIRSADLVVSMGGYNTLCQIVSNRTPALIVPRIEPRMEQTMRAQRWAKLGLVHVMDPVEPKNGLPMSARQLADRVCGLLESDSTTPDPSTLDLQGLDRIAARFATFCQPETQRATPVRL